MRFIIRYFFQIEILTLNLTNMRMRKNYFGLLVLFLFLPILEFESNAQVNVKGTPKSFKNAFLKSLSDIPYVTLPSFNIAAMIKEDSLSQDHSKPLRFAKGFDVSYSIYNSGVWETLENGDKLWRLGIRSPGAFAINVLFSEYELPDSAKVFIYNKKMSHVIGAFTSKNNSKSKILATTPVTTDEIIVEYYEPKNVESPGKLTIGSVGHDYIGITRACLTPPQGGSCKGNSLSCEKDINCTEGSNWQDEKHAVCRIFFRETSGNYGICSGALINNTAQNGAPFFLTANHCVCSDAIAQTVVVLFNYESSTCNGADGSLAQTVSGTTLRAHWDFTDFSLLQLNSAPPVTYNAYLLGWDRSGTVPSVPAVTIHHPSGDVKKISVITSTLNSANFYDGSTSDICVPYLSRDTWHVPSYSVGVTEAGSSGSPLIDLNRRVVGQLYGGYSTCTSPNNDYYGRLSSSWLGNNTMATQLKHWLDTLSTGANTVNGMYLPYITATNTLVCASGVNFTLHNSPSGSSITWQGSQNLDGPTGSGTTVSFSAKSNANSSGYVQAFINSNSYPIQFDVWVGTPQITNQKVDGNSYSPGMQICPGNHYLTVTPIGGNAGSATWTVPTGITYSVGTNQLNFTLPNSVSSVAITCRSTNSCGTGTNGSFYLTKKTYGCPSSLLMTVYPNPTSEIANITLTEDNSTIPADGSDLTDIGLKTKSVDQVTYTVKIYNSQSFIVSTLKRSGNNFTVPLTNLADGTYIIEVTDGKNAYRQALIVKHN